MTAEFNLWLLLVGLIAGAGLTWIVIAELRRSDSDIEESERGLEAGWIADQLAGSDDAVDEEQAAAVLRLHSRYLAVSLPPAEDEDHEAVSTDLGTDPAVPDRSADEPELAAAEAGDGGAAISPSRVRRRRARSSG